MSRKRSSTGSHRGKPKPKRPKAPAATATLGKSWTRILKTERSELMSIVRRARDTWPDFNDFASRHVLNTAFAKVGKQRPPDVADRASALAEKAALAQVAGDDRFDGRVKTWWRSSGRALLIGVKSMSADQLASAAAALGYPRCMHRLKCVRAPIQAAVAVQRVASYELNPSQWPMAKTRCPKCDGELWVHQTPKNCTDACRAQVKAANAMKDDQKQRLLALKSKPVLRRCACGCAAILVPGETTLSAPKATSAVLLSTGTVSRCKGHVGLALGLINISVGGASCDGCKLSLSGMKCVSCSCFDPGRVAASIRPCAACVTSHAVPVEAPPPFPPRRSGAVGGGMTICTRCVEARRVREQARSSSAKQARARGQDDGEAQFKATMPREVKEKLYARYQEHQDYAAAGWSATQLHDHFHAIMGECVWLLDYAAIVRDYKNWVRRGGTRQGGLFN